MTSVFAKGKLKAAKEAIGKKDYATAENAALQVLEYEPDNYHANVFVGLASLEIGKNEQSENAYRKAIALNPEQLLAWQGLSKYYERTKSWNELAETLRKMMDLFAKAGDTTKCAETLQRYVELRRSYGSQEEVAEAISLYLPESPYYSVLSTLPPPDPTAPTSTTTFASQVALHNSLPILEELVSMEEKREKEFVTKEVEKRRMRIGSSPLNILKLEVGREVGSSSKLPRLYGEVIGHPQTSDELRRSTEAKLLRQRHSLLTATPASGSTAQEKKSLQAEVEELINGFILLKIPDSLAWNAYLERCDYERLEDYPTSTLQQYLQLLPNERLCSMIKAFLIFHGQPLTEDEEDDDSEKQVKQDEEEEDPFALALEGFSQNQNSIFAHRTMAEFYLNEEDWEQARKVAESGLILIRQSEKDYGGPLPLAKKAFNICIATALVYLFPPKHHLRAAGLLDDVLSVDPDNVRCLMARAMVYQYAQNWKNAETIYQRVQAIAGSDDVEEGLEAREQAAWCAIQDGRPAETADEMREVIDVLDALEQREYQQARAWWRLGKAYWDIAGEKRNEAYNCWITALKRSNSFAPAFTSLGIHYLECASPPDPARASKCFQKAFELDPREGEAARRLAEGFAEEKEWDLVEVVASRTIAGEGGVTGGMDDTSTTNKRQYLPTNAWAWKAMGVVELNRGNYTQAIQAFQVTLRGEEEDFESWLRLGEAYVHAGRHVAAIKALDRAQELNPDDWSCKFVKGDALRRVYQFDQAIEYFRSVLAIKPDDPGARIALAGTSLDLGKAQRLSGYIGRAEESLKLAVDTALAMITDAPGFKAMSWKIIGDALYELGRRSSFGRPQSIHETLVAVENALPSDIATDAGKTGHPLANASNELAQGTAEGDSAVALALAAYQARLSLIESSADAYAGAAYDVAVTLKQLASSVDEELKETFLKEAIDLLKKAVRAEPTNAIYWNALGALRAFDNVKLAQHSFIMSIEVDNKSPIAWTNLGLLYLNNEDLELANHAFYRAQTLDPDYSLAWVGQAIVATKNDHVAEARALLEHSITLSAAIPEADLEFASRTFTLYVKGTSKAGDHDVLFLPFAVLDRYSQQRPDDATALHLFALICERLGQQDLAVTLMERVIAVLEAAYNKSEDAETERHFALAQVNLGRLRVSQSEYADAIEALKMATNLLQNGEDEITVLLRAHASYCMGLAFFGLTEYGEAIGTLETALEQVPEGLVAVRGHIILLLSQTLWQLGSEEAREAGKTQLLTAIAENSRNMDAITALAAYGMLNLDDDLLDAALSEIRAMPIDERQSLDPEGTVEHLLTHHHLGQGLIKDAAILMEAGVHATPMASKPRLRLARLLIQQGRPEQARAVLAGLLDTKGQADRSHVAETLSLAALALAQSGSKSKGSDRTALMEAQRAVFLDPSLQLASPHHLSNPARIAARLSLTASPSHCYYRRGYSAGPTPSPSTNTSPPKDTLASPNNGSSLRKKVDLHPAPRKPSPAEVSATPPKPPPPAPSSSSTQSVAPTEKHSTTDAHPETDQASLIRLAIEDMQKATQHGILSPPPENAGTVRRLLHQGIQLFKFYIRGIKLIGVHRKTVRDIRKRLAAEQAEGREAKMTRWESQFIKTYRQDLKKLAPFLLIVLVIEEIIPLIVMYVPGILPSTCILPSQLERIQTKAENTRKGAVKSVSSLLKDVKVEDLKSVVAGGLNSLDGALLKELCRVFGQGSWGPGILARRRLERHLEYLKTDDSLLAAEGKGIRLSVPELRIALWDRGFVVDGVAESALRSKLANWVDAAHNKEDADRLQMALKCAKK